MGRQRKRTLMHHFVRPLTEVVCCIGLLGIGSIKSSFELIVSCSPSSFTPNSFNGVTF